MYIFVDLGCFPEEEVGGEGDLRLAYPTHSVDIHTYWYLDVDVRRKRERKGKNGEEQTGRKEQGKRRGKQQWGGKNGEGKRTGRNELREGKVGKAGEMGGKQWKWREMGLCDEYLCSTKGVKGWTIEKEFSPGGNDWKDLWGIC